MVFYKMPRIRFVVGSSSFLTTETISKSTKHVFFGQNICMRNIFEDRLFENPPLLWLNDIPKSVFILLAKNPQRLYFNLCQYVLYYCSSTIYKIRLGVLASGPPMPFRITFQIGLVNS